jgi:hypothetical protein
VTIAVICPTRNRAQNWRTGPLPATMRYQTRPPDEILIALDHCDDDSLDAVRSADLGPSPVRILDVLVPRPEPLPASGFPDNCLFHAAASDIVIHVDDDLELPPGLIAAVAEAFVGGNTFIVWPQTDFVDVDLDYLNDPTDCRAHAKGLTPLPFGFREIPRSRRLHWGAAYVAPRSLIQYAGGHRLEDCGYHNTDTRLGCRLARMAPSYLATAPSWRILHHGLTWHLAHKDDPVTIEESRSRSAGPPIANLGHRFWTSPWFESAYRELDTSRTQAII